MSNRKSKSPASKSASKTTTPLWVWLGLGGLAVIVIAVLALQGTGAAATTTALPAEITVAQAVAKRDAGAFILDVREPDEWNEYHVPGATLIPLGELAARVNEVPRDKEVVVVCRSGNRSQVGRDTLISAGFTKVTSLTRGLKAWTAANLPTVTGP